MHIRHFLSITLLLLAFSCEQLSDQRTRAEPPALPPVYVDPAPFINLSASKMNVVYIGVDNPLELQSLGVNLNDVTLLATPPGYISEYEKNYVLKVSKPGLQEVKVLHKGKLFNEFTFRAKRLPDPIARLGNNSSGKMSSGEFRAQQGVIAIYKNLDFDVRCQVMGFEISCYRPEVGGWIKQNNTGGRYNKETSALVAQAATRQVYTFTKVEAKCPGDAVPRLINPMVFEIF